MGIQVEFNPDLALRKFGTKGRLEDECLPRELTPLHIHNFLKEGQRNYYLQGEIPLVETQGNQQLSRPLASIEIIEYTNFLKDNKPYTKGRFMIHEVYNINDKTIHFEGMNKI
ncbi:MAG: hypothetical protein WCX73_02300 [Candidatus Pacearchaeota archaeon]|jgi:hypothetical protein